MYLIKFKNYNISAMIYDSSVKCKGFYYSLYRISVSIEGSSVQRSNSLATAVETDELIDPLFVVLTGVHDYVYVVFKANEP